MYIKTYKYKAAFILVSSSLLILGFQMFMSSIYSLKTDLVINNWQKQQHPPEKNSWDAALDSSLKAKEWYPTKDAFLEERIGKVYQWSTYDKPGTSPLVTKNREAALNAYRQQTELTPKWPKAWFNLMSIKIELHQFDKEFYNAYRTAEQTTQETPNMQTAFALIGIQAWHGVDTKTKSLILKKIIGEVKTSAKNAKDIKPLLESYNLLGITCVYAKSIHAETYKLCL